MPKKYTPSILVFYLYKKYFCTNYHFVDLPVGATFNLLNFCFCCFLSVWSTRARAQCGQEELALCAKSLHILQSTSDLSIATKKEDLEKICP